MSERTQVGAAWSRRILASIVDFAAMITPPVVIFIVLLASGDRDTIRALVAFSGLCCVSGLVYGPLLMSREGRHNGQTFGKQLLGIRVVRLEKTPLNLGSSFVREVVVKQLLLGLGAFVFFIPNVVDALWPLWDRKGQSLHDKLVSTRVVPASEDVD